MPLSALLQRHRRFHDCLVAAMAASLAAASALPSALPTATALLWLVGLADGWRAALTHYWLVGLASLVLVGDAERGRANLAVMLGGLYLWAGLLKLSRDFFKDVAPVVFWPSA